MKTPPLLLGAALLFWGWQTGHLVAGTAMAAALEGARLSKARWEFTDEDFRRIWIFCALLLLAAALYAFSASDGPAGVRGFFQNPSLATERNAGNATSRTVAALMRWLPMIFFLFVAAQAFGSRGGVPQETISVILRLRWQRARRLGRPLPAAGSVDVPIPTSCCASSPRASIPARTRPFSGACARCWLGRFGRTVRSGMAWSSGRAPWRPP